MIKAGTKWVNKTYTDVWSRQPHGTLHGYDYFENDDGRWIFNISFHTGNGCFGDIQLKEMTCIPIEEAIEKARANFLATEFVPQPDWPD